MRIRLNNKFFMICMLLVLCNLFTLTTLASIKEQVTIVKNDGDTLFIIATLQEYNKTIFFPCDDKKIVKGKLNGKNIKIKKTEINKIILKDKTEYIVIPFRKKHIIGFFTLEGNVDVFKTYRYEGLTVYTSQGPITYGDKKASVQYYLMQDDDFLSMGPSDFIRDKSQNCPSLKNYLRKNASLEKSVHKEKALKFYNEHCTE